MSLSKYRLKAYITVEAAYIFPITIGIIYLFISSSLSLFCFCYQSQRVFIDELKEARITFSGDGFEEVIYENIENNGEKKGGVIVINPLYRIMEEWNEG